MFNDKELIQIITGHDAVINAFNPFQQGIATADGYQAQINGTESLIGTIKKAGVKRLLMVGGAGSLEVAPGALLVDAPEFPTEWKDMALAMGIVLSILKN